MIIVQLKGGLGNQMFQYAAGRALALKNNTHLKLDLSYLKNGVLGENVAYRKYGLNKFNIEEDIIIDVELEKFERKSNLHSQLKISWLNRKAGNRFPIEKTINQKGHGYDPSFRTISKNSYLIGYWQNPGYFNGAEDIIKHDFTFKSLPENESANYLEEIEKSESVAIHIRRGDFKNLPVLGMTGIKFYEDAVKYLSLQKKNAVLFFFSDELSWVRENFDYLNSSHKIFYVDINSEGGREAEDLRLMSKCKHNIIGNSTFGWWGAWLNSNPEKILIAPERLFADPVIDQQLQGMIPDNWIRL